MAASLSFIENSSAFFSIPTYQAAKLGKELKTPPQMVKNIYYYGGGYRYIVCSANSSKRSGYPFSTFSRSFRLLPSR